MRRNETYSWQLIDLDAMEVMDDGVRFAWNSAIRAAEEALRDVGGGTATGDPVIRGRNGEQRPLHGERAAGDTYSRFWRSRGRRMETRVTKNIPND